MTKKISRALANLWFLFISCFGTVVINSRVRPLWFAVLCTFIYCLMNAGLLIKVLAEMEVFYDKEDY